MMEKLMLGLRTSNGIALNTIREWIGNKEESLLFTTIQSLSSYCSIDQQKLILTPKGRLVANTIITEIWRTIEKILGENI